ncbi:BTB domain-containing protein [Mycena sanguinolenta]|uniref:BTB domain-containing protein n=1 Tax=Mycena sanguinolenta TaxID=230812 RepID=A0A8H6ZIC3_9AGAR|nr:BTB domain-containing protein [Mycena sanguinolenta]
MPLNIFVWQPFPWAYYAVYLGLLISALTIRPSPYRRLIFLPMLFLTWRLLHDSQAGYLTSTFWFAYLLVASDYILLTDVQRELHPVPDAVDTRSPGITIRNVEKAPLGIRLKWALQLFFNARGVGWAHEPRFAFASRAPPNTPRIKFIVRQLALFCVYFLLFDLGNLHARWNPGFALRLGMVSPGWRWRVVGTVVWAITCSAGMSLAHCSASIVCVGLGVSRPQDWPPLFGDLMDVTSVRTFWARGWHQLFRRFLCSHAKYLARSEWVRTIAPDGSVASSWVQMCFAFAISGLMHHLGESVPMGVLAQPLPDFFQYPARCYRCGDPLRVFLSTGRSILAKLCRESIRTGVGRSMVHTHAPNNAGSSPEDREYGLTSSREPDHVVVAGDLDFTSKLHIK